MVGGCCCGVIFLMLMAPKNKSIRNFKEIPSFKRGTSIEKNGLKTEFSADVMPRGDDGAGVVGRGWFSDAAIDDGDLEETVRSGSRGVVMVRDARGRRMGSIFLLKDEEGFGEGRGVDVKRKRRVTARCSSFFVCFLLYFAFSGFLFIYLFVCVCRWIADSVFEDIGSSYIRDIFFFPRTHPPMIWTPAPETWGGLPSIKPEAAPEFKGFQVLIRGSGHYMASLRSFRKS